MIQTTLSARSAMPGLGDDPHFVDRSVKVYKRWNFGLIVNKRIHLEFRSLFNELLVELLIVCLCESVGACWDGHRREGHGEAVETIARVLGLSEHDLRRIRIAPVPGGVLIVEAKGRSVKDSPLATGIAATPATDVHSEDHRSALDRKVLQRTPIAAMTQARNVLATRTDSRVLAVSLYIYGPPWSVLNTRRSVTLLRSEKRFA